MAFAWLSPLETDLMSRQAIWTGAAAASTVIEPGAAAVSLPWTVEPSCFVTVTTGATLAGDLAGGVAARQNGMAASSSAKVAVIVQCFMGNTLFGTTSQVGSRT